MSAVDRSQSATRRNLKAASEEHVSTAAAAQQRAREAMKKKNKTSIWDKYQYQIIIGGFIFIVVVTLLSTLLGKTKKLHLTPVIETDEIESHNQHEYGYKLGPNSFFQDQTLADAKKVFNNFFSYKQSLSRCTALEEGNILEEEYDFREAYPKCTAPIADQKNCSSSFAVASAGALSDRFCKATGQNVRLSAQQFLSCQEGNDGKECEQGGAIASFLDFAKRKGLVDDKCAPYVGENGVPCDPAFNDCEKYKVQDYCVAGGIEGIKRDILNNGPAIGYLPAYRDFLVYKSGIYRVPEGTSKFQGGHAVKIIGWGQSDNGENYWLVENSWGEDWGEKGTARIAMGQEDLFLDQYAFSPQPQIFGKDDDLDEPATEKPDVVDV